LSRIDVQVDQMVAKDELIGLTGTTGMVGGDHLHFSMVVHNTFVNPVEWWDATWIKNNITSKIKDVQSVTP
jgi:murein DD-endopeptidase MepM/ murein hydrolase activator NlpD